MSGDNNFLLIILIAIIIFWINCINTKASKAKYYEKFGAEKSPLLSDNTKTSTNTNDNFKTLPKEGSDNKSFSNNVKSNPSQDLFTKPPVTNLDTSKLVGSYNSMAKQYITNDKQVMYSDITSNSKTDGFSSINTDSYMLIPPNSMPDKKFDKVMSKDKARPVLGSGDLLPKDENKDWFQVPNSKFNLMQAIDLEIPEIKIGIDTVGQSRKNATYDLRACPPNPKFVVSPWSNSTIEPDYNTKPLC